MIDVEQEKHAKEANVREMYSPADPKNN